MFADLTIHYCNIIMGAMASQITSPTIVYSTVHSGADQRKHHSSASPAFVLGIHRSPVNSPHKWPVTPKMFPFDDVIMELSAWPPYMLVTVIGQRWKYQLRAYKWLCRMDNFNGVYLNFRRTKTTKIFIQHRWRCLNYWYKILKWYDDRLSS